MLEHRNEGLADRTCRIRGSGPGQRVKRLGRQELESRIQRLRKESRIRLWRSIGSMRIPTSCARTSASTSKLRSSMSFSDSTQSFVLDTGATADPIQFPLYETVRSLVGQRNQQEIRILVAHSHSHGDHRAADPQFRGKPGVTLVEPTPKPCANFSGSRPGRVARRRSIWVAACLKSFRRRDIKTKALPCTTRRRVGC